MGLLGRLLKKDNSQDYGSPAEYTTVEEVQPPANYDAAEEVQPVYAEPQAYYQPESVYSEIPFAAVDAPKAAHPSTLITDIVAPWELQESDSLEPSAGAGSELQPAVVSTPMAPTMDIAPTY